jgi:hypothetical protein
MSRVKVSAFRERGLRCLSSAEPQVWSTKHKQERKADTMKTYILGKFPSVERQKTTPPLNGPAVYIGLDVHTDSIAVSLAPSDSTEVRRYGIIGGLQDDVLKVSKKLQAAHPESVLKFCYEAGPHGYPLYRFLRGHGYECMVVSPSKVPRKPGDRVKTNRRDADQLARLFRAGELTPVTVPDVRDEAVRDFLRARFQISGQQHRARQQLKMFLLRHNFRYGGGTAWSAAHLRYLAKIKCPSPNSSLSFRKCSRLSPKPDNGWTVMTSNWKQKERLVVGELDPEKKPKKNKKTPKPARLC